MNALILLRVSFIQWGQFVRVGSRWNWVRMFSSAVLWFLALVKFPLVKTSVETVARDLVLLATVLNRNVSRFIL